MKITPVKIKTAQIVLDLLWPEFVVVDDCVFLKEEWLVNKHCYDPKYPMQSESDMNHTHILQYLKHDAGSRRAPYFKTKHPDFIAACAFAKKICWAWAGKLAVEFRRDTFRVYYCGFDPIVRFHKVRKGEANWVEPSDWPDGIALGKVLILEARKGRVCQLSL